MSAQAGGDRKLFTGSAIEVYTSTLSAQAGEEVTIHVSTTAQWFDLTIARVGVQQTIVWHREQLRGEFHPTPAAAWEGCDWPASVAITIPEDWRSGYYQITAATADSEEPVERFQAFLVVRAAVPSSRTLLVLATNTYAAYNGYGGGSLYESHDGAHLHEYRVSNQRPWMPGFLAKPDSYDVFHWFDREWTDDYGHRIAGLAIAAGFHNWERVMVQWLERNGYDVDFAVQTDLELRPELLAGYRLMLSVGHDEYWSWGQRDAVESFIEGGGNVCFFSGNVCCVQVRIEDAGNTVITYKWDYKDDPVYQAGPKERTATLWIHHELGRPESRLTGLSTMYAGFSRFHSVAPNGPSGLLVYRPEHWLFEHTGISYGDCLGQRSMILHYELDGCPIRLQNGLPYPEAYHDADPSLEILAMAPACMEMADFDHYGITYDDFLTEWLGPNARAIEYLRHNRGHAVMGIYVNNGIVFSAGTTDWTNGLTGQDPAVEQITRNLIDRLSIGPAA